MSQHNIIGWERSGPHCIVRRVKSARRRTFFDTVLRALGGLALLIISIASVFALYAWSVPNVG